MTAMSNHPVIDENDSDAESDSTDDSQFYHPISSYDLDDTEELGDTRTPAILTNGGNLEHELIPNLTGLHLLAENGIAALDLNGYSRILASEEEEEATAREREASILRAFREDESRRNAPLPPENSARIVSVMRGVSFPDYTPDWVNRVPEDQWLDQLRRLRGESTSQS
ncbi:hypothetical protein IEQ34_001889 [Dendrobium chrysotoxum]|uniref:Uncharacterized protein n=1 Tax=Dendrobium chrysotoxum TaxID=161865 RepID=A0AAV7HIE2_DENCH|nr:hypothetical protein IEQ34_001889 [Dendrobium chrysotoxum]